MARPDPLGAPIRLAILTDAHANLPALRAALAAVDRFAPDVTVHTGDAIGTGPYPRECLELLLARPATRCLLGNHDARFAPRTGAEADALFGGGAWMTFYGHDHTAADLTGAATRYVNPGSLGCSPTSAARVALLDVRSADDWALTYASSPYDATDLLRAFDERDVPDRELIRRVFMPRDPNPPRA